MKKNFPILASVSGIFFTQFYFNNNAIKYQKSKVDSCNCMPTCYSHVPACLGWVFLGCSYMEIASDYISDFSR